MSVAASSPENLDAVLHALADPTRRDILARTMRSDASVSGLARHYPMSFAAVQKHVAVLERAGLVAKRRRGREVLVRGRGDALGVLNGLMDSLETLWRARLDRIAELLDESPAAHPNSR